MKARAYAKDVLSSRHHWQPGPWREQRYERQGSASSIAAAVAAIAAAAAAAAAAADTEIQFFPN